MKNYNFEEKYEAIISFYAIYHIPREEHIDLFLKMYDLLKDDGMILVTLGAKSSIYNLNPEFAGATMAWSTFGHKEYKKMIKKIGFKILEATLEGKSGDKEYHLRVLAKK